MLQRQQISGFLPASGRFPDGLRKLPADIVKKRLDLEPAFTYTIICRTDPEK